jgi:hypothetical protein
VITDPEADLLAYLGAAAIDQRGVVSLLRYQENT